MCHTIKFISRKTNILDGTRIALYVFVYFAYLLVVCLYTPEDVRENVTKNNN